MNANQKLSQSRRQDIANLLKSRRYHIQPQEVGLPEGSRRRTPGLRREEVSQLSGISLEWYTWLEQARDIRASVQTLRKIAKTLCLQPSEEALLLRLSGYELSQLSSNEQPKLSPQIQCLLDQQYPSPAFITSDRWDIIAWNESTKILMGDLDKQNIIERNTLYNMFMSEHYRNILLDWDYHAKGVISKLHAVTPEWDQDPWSRELIERLQRESKDFSKYWNEREIKGYEDGFKAYEFPTVGRLNFDFISLKAMDERYHQMRIIIYLPRDTETENKLNRLLGETN